MTTLSFFSPASYQKVREFWLVVNLPRNGVVSGTVFSFIAIIAAFVSLFQSGKIDLKKWSGKIYFYFTLVASLTALGLSSVKGVNPGHILALFIVILIAAAYYLFAKKPGNNRSRFFENFFLSFSFFLSLLPTVNETFTRVPVGHPLANGLQDPLIAKTLLVLLVLFIEGSILQFRQQSRINRLITNDPRSGYKSA